MTGHSSPPSPRKSVVPPASKPRKAVPADDASDDGKRTVRVSTRGAFSSQFELQLESKDEEPVVVVVEASTPGPILAGQSVACALRSDDARVSRRHVAFEYTPLGLRVRDLGSTNGTFLGDTRIFEALLTGGERLRLGSDVFVSVERVRS